MHRPVPSFGRITWTDYWAFLCALVAVMFPVVFIGIILFEIEPKGGSDSFFWTAILGPVVGIPGLFWRVSHIRGVFERGEEVTGVVTLVSFFRDRGRAEYAYRYRDENLTSGNALHKTGRAKALQEGQQVTLVVDPEKPSRAFIRELYVGE